MTYLRSPVRGLAVVSALVAGFVLGSVLVAKAGGDSLGSPIGDMTASGGGGSANAPSSAGSTGQILRSNAASPPPWSTATYPNTCTANRLMYCSATDTWSALASANSSVAVTDGSGVPSWSTTLPNMAIGTPTSGTLTNCTGYTAANLSGLGTGVATGLAANVVGSGGGLVTATSPTFVTSALSPFFGTTAADIADAGGVRLGTGEYVAWERSPTGTDLQLAGNGTSIEIIGATTFRPSVDDGVALGSSTNQWSNVVSGIFTSGDADPADAGAVRLGANEKVAWEGGTERFITSDGSTISTNASFVSTSATDLGTSTAGWDSLWVNAVKSTNGSDVADAGLVRLNNAEVIGWEASPAGTDVTITANASEQVVVTAAGGFIATFRNADLAAGSCTANEVAIDTAGGTRELCICNAAGTAYDCWSADTANGPTN